MFASNRIALKAAACVALSFLCGCGGADKPEDLAQTEQAQQLPEAATSEQPGTVARTEPQPAGLPWTEVVEAGEAPDAKPALPPYPYEKGTAAVRGRVVLKERYRPMDIIDMTGIPACADCWTAEHPPRYEYIVTGKDGGLANVIVHVSKGLEGYAFELPKDPVVLDQVQCRFRPHVLAVMANQELKVRNLDNTPHNVEFTFGGRYGMGGMEYFGDFSETFPEPGLAELRCEAHTWMSAYMMVLPHHFHAVTWPDGAYEIKGLIPGTYTLSFWHEYGEFAAPDQTITLKDGEEREDVNANFVKVEE